MQRVHWPERDIDVVLYGTRGEVPVMHRGLKKPMLDAVAPGQMVVGYEVHTKLGLAQGDQVTLMGREFTVSKLHPQRGSTDDVTVLGRSQDGAGAAVAAEPGARHPGAGMPDARGIGSRRSARSWRQYCPARR